MNDNKESASEQRRAPMNREQWQAIAVAYGQLAEIRDKSLPSKEDETTAGGLVEFLAQNFLEFAPDFLGSWITVQQEYAPLLKALIPSITRAQAIDNHNRAANDRAGKIEIESGPSALVPANITQLHPGAVLKSRLASPAGAAMVQLTGAQQEQALQALRDAGKV